MDIGQAVGERSVKNQNIFTFNSVYLPKMLVLAQWKGQFYHASGKFERSVFYDDKITVSLNGVWWIWPEQQSSCF